MDYYRAYVALTEEQPGFSLPGKKAFGKAIVDARGESGKLLVSAQGLQPNELYKVYLVAKSVGAPASRYSGVFMADLRVDEKGSAELKLTFDASNVGESGFAVGAFDVVAIVVHNAPVLTAPLVGYVAEPVFWKNGFEVAKKKESEIQTSDSAEVTETTTVADDITEAAEVVVSEDIVEEAEVAVLEDITETAECSEDIMETAEASEDIVEEAEIAASEDIMETAEVSEDIVEETAEIEEEVTSAAVSAQDDLAEEVDSGYDSFDENEAVADDLPEARVESAATDEGTVKHISPEAMEKLTHMFKRNARMAPFINHPGDVIWIRISPEHARLIGFPEIAASQLATTAYRRYRHLVLGRTTSDRYTLGIPGVFTPQTLAMAEALGLSFSQCNGGGPVENSYGYWVIHARVN